ncbi:MAG: hypothetical protein AB4041_02060 [Microcystaceae cyanobacterium]
MKMQPFSKLLARHPQLKYNLEQENFLIGYSAGGQRGQLLSVFLLNSPWREYCLEAKALEVIPSGGVLIISDDEPWELQGSWQAYYWDAPFVPTPRSSLHRQLPTLTHLATEISIESAQQGIKQKASYSSR